MHKNRFPRASGTFIQPDMVANWDDKKWQKELFYLKEVNMKYIIINSFIVKNHNIKRIYRTSLKSESQFETQDIIDICLRNCEKAGFKVFIGIDYNILWWKIGPRKPEWLYIQMRKSNYIIHELYKKYYRKYKKAFYGWYWVYEVDNLNFKDKKDFKILANAININLNYMNNSNTRLPIMLSPFMNSKYSTPQNYADNWKYFFKLAAFQKGDIFCPQDSVGGGGLDITEVVKWFGYLYKAVKTKGGLLFWANVETFSHKDWSSAPIKRFIKQMRIENKFVEDIVTFSYSHYYSPCNINSGFHNAYKEYLFKHLICSKNRELPQFKLIDRTANKISIQLKISKNTAGYKIYYNGNEICHKSVQRNYGGNNSKDFGKIIIKIDDKNSPQSKYEIVIIDFWGNLSKKVRIKLFK